MTKNNLGMGVMIGMLGGNEETVRAITASIGREIARVRMARSRVRYEDNVDKVELVFTDGSVLAFWDGGQSCCEHRWMTCDDQPEFPRFVGAKFATAETVAGPEVPKDGDVTEVQFLNIVTSKGTIQCATHNSHNGYYGGFWIEASLTPKGD